MAGMITNIVAKTTTGAFRLLSYGLGLAAVGKLFEFGFRGLNYVTSGWTAEGSLADKAIKRLDVWDANPRPYTKNGDGEIIKDLNDLKAHEKANRDIEWKTLLAQMVALGVAAGIIHDATFYFEGSVPKIYNFLLQATPIRVPNQSIFSSIKNTFTHLNPNSLKNLFYPQGSAVPVRFSTFAGKALTMGIRLGALGIGITAANKQMELGFKVIDLFPPTGFSSTETGAKIAAKAEKWNFQLFNPRGADRNTKTTTLIAQIAKLTALSLVIHEAIHFAEGTTPRIYNFALTPTPVRVLNSSIFQSMKYTWKNFNAKELFVLPPEA